ncbi:alpha/beta fold hydrolase [Myxococcus qinghaiensis]|uniref:alpha/beta fold hydrolase n=1 Tax=Myxococcus qinghaiensis TaxID=2906758 RepID=UPI0020A77E81|nr:alpha/beta hydrolase [Myxococcus qinghaiensis]MCP3168160.1 alpha/beta hydrolase [Myxococcus qinghaiensis]
MDSKHSAPSQHPSVTHQLRRRGFLVFATGALAASALPGCMSRASSGTSSPEGGALDAAAYHSSRRYLDSRFGRIAYVERGKGEAALFLHGFPLNSFQWRGAIERLSPYRRCVAPDFMGLGYTEVAEGQSYAPAAQVDMLVELLDRLAIKSVDVIANDSGGAIAQLLVTRHPERVRTLLLTNCDVESECPPAAVLPVIEMARKGAYVDAWLAPWLADKALARSEKGFGGICYSNPSQPTDEAIEYYFAPLVRSPRGKAQAHAYTLALEDNALAGIGPALQQCTVPTRILWGTGDTLFSQSSADHLDQAFGVSRGVRRVPGAKLFFPEEYPDLIAEEARRLWGIG